MSNETIQQIAPFGFGMFLLLAQPVLDMVWLGNLKRNYKAEFEDVAGAAEWVSGVSSFLPNAALTAFGALLLAVDSPDPNTDWILWAAFAILLASFVLYVREAALGKPTKKPILRLFGHLHVWLFALNCLGIFFAVHYD